MKLLPFNLLYQTKDSLLVSSCHIRQRENLIGIIVGDTAFGLKEYKLPWLNAQTYLAQHKIGNYPPVLPTPQQMQNLLINRELFNRTVDVLRRYNIMADKLDGDFYWTDTYHFCETYLAVSRRRLDISPHSGETTLSFRPCLHLK